MRPSASATGVGNRPVPEARSTYGGSISVTHAPSLHTSPLSQPGEQLFAGVMQVSVPAVAPSMHAWPCGHVPAQLALADATTTVVQSLGPVGAAPDARANRSSLLTPAPSGTPVARYATTGAPLPSIAIDVWI